MSSPHAPDPEDVPPAPLDPESRKAAAALSSLDSSSTTMDAAPTPNTNVDQEALGKAMEGLKSSRGGGGGGGGDGATAAATTTAMAMRARKVRVDAADVAIVVCCRPRYAIYAYRR
jgi:hypothetical protein